MTASVTSVPRKASASRFSFCRIFAEISGGENCSSLIFTRTSLLGPSTTL